VLRRERIEYKTPEQVAVMRRAGLVVAETLAAARDAVRPGVSTRDVDRVGADVVAAAGATSSFLGYHGYPATLCISVNDEVVHGIPGDRVIQAGDVVSIDAGAIVDGWHGDAAFSMVVPPAEPPDEALVQACEDALWAGIAALARADRLGEVGGAIEDAVVAAGRFAVVREYVGHGIGSAMHQPPEVRNFRTRERGPRVVPGLCVAIEPMITRGERHTEVLGDGWTVVTADGSRAAHCEHTVAVLQDGILVLTSPDGGAARLAEHGVRIASLPS
jgi:methionyl aminopeptidase